MTVCIDCKKDLSIPRDTVCQPCVQKWYLAQKEIAESSIEQTPRVRARACLYFRPANVTFSESEQE